MSRKLAKTIGLALATAIASSGCGFHSAPFQFNSTQELAHYNTVATQVEYPSLNSACVEPPPASMSPDAIGRDAAPTYWDMKLDEAMQTALTRSKVLHEVGGQVLNLPNTVQTIHGPAIADTDPRSGVEAALAEYDAVFSMKADSQKNNRELNNIFVGQGTQHFIQDTDVFLTQISKLEPTGTEFTFRNNTTYDHNNATGNQFPSAWDTNYEAEFRQSLLQGGGLEFNRIAGPKNPVGVYNGVLIARINTDISLVDFEVGLRDLASNVENAYWDLYYAYRDLDAKVAARDSALESWRKTHALFLAGRRGGEAEREAEAREQYFQFEEDVQNAWSGKLIEGTQTYNGSAGGTFRPNGGVRVCERRLRALLELPITDGRLIRPADEPSLAKVVFNWDEVVPEALARRAELRRQQWQVKRRELELIASRNFLLPQLDAFGLYRFRGFGQDLIGPKNDSEQFANAYQDLLTGAHEEWELGMELNVPLGERKGHAAVRNAQLALARERAILEDQQREVIHGLSDAMADVDRAYEVAQIDYNRRLAARRELAATKAAYDSDKVPLDLVLESQRRVADAESHFYGSLVEYALSVKNLHYEKGSLLDYNEISLAEGPWPGKAYNDASKRQPARRPWPLNYIMRDPPTISAGPVPPMPVMPPQQPGPNGPNGPPESPPELIPNPPQQPGQILPPPAQAVPSPSAPQPSIKPSAPAVEPPAPQKPSLPPPAPQPDSTAMQITPLKSAALPPLGRQASLYNDLSVPPAGAPSDVSHVVPTSHVEIPWTPPAETPKPRTPTVVAAPDPTLKLVPTPTPAPTGPTSAAPSMQQPSSPPQTPPTIPSPTVSIYDDSNWNSTNRPISSVIGDSPLRPRRAVTPATAYGPAESSVAPRAVQPASYPNTLRSGKANQNWPAENVQPLPVAPQIGSPSTVNQSQSDAVRPLPAVDPSVQPLPVVRQ